MHSAPEKDVDWYDRSFPWSGVFTRQEDQGFPPCTPQACMEILDHYGIDCTGKKAVVIGRSLVVGKPAAMMLVKEKRNCNHLSHKNESICRL